MSMSRKKLMIRVQFLDIAVIFDFIKVLSMSRKEVAVKENQILDNIPCHSITKMSFLSEKLKKKVEMSVISVYKGEVGLTDE